MRIREIENRLKECCNVREVCVLSSPVHVGPARYHAFVVLSKNTPDVRARFQAHCNVRLKRICMSIKLQVMEGIPKTMMKSVYHRGSLAVVNPKG